MDFFRQTAVRAGEIGGGPLANPDMPARLELQGPPAAHFMRNGQVALSEGGLFGPGWEGFVRLNLGTSRPILAEVVDRMAKAVGRQVDRR